MQKTKTHINLAVIGHIDSGKSTTAGHLLYQCGAVDSQTIEKLNLSSSPSITTPRFSWILDKLESERNRGVTIDISVFNFQTEVFNFTLIDSPGHRDFIKNMLTGTSQADAAILVVSASSGEFEAGMSEEGQTREHALLAYTLGVKQMIVVVNKMDHPCCNWSECRFGEVKKDLSNYLRRLGYNPEKIPFIPVSGLLGDNIVESSQNLPWYSGPSLVNALDLLSPPRRNPNRPLRMPIQEVYRITGIGTVAVGRVETGVVRIGTVVQFTPSDICVQVSSIQMHHEAKEIAYPGDYIGFHASGVSVTDIKRGYVVSEWKNDPAKECESFVAQIFILGHPGVITAGYTPVLDCHTAHIACRFDRLLSKINKITAASIEDEPKSLKKGDAALVLVVPNKPMCVEAFNEYPGLGRFAVRDIRHTVAVGVVRQVNKKKDIETPNHFRTVGGKKKK